MLHPKIHSDLRVTLESLGPLDQLQNNLLVVKVGSPENPATREELDDVARSMKELLGPYDLNVYVTHHAVEFKTLPINTQIVNKSQT